MNSRNKPHRQIYNRQQLNKQILKNRQIVAPRKQKKLNIAQDIVKEIEKEENKIDIEENKEGEKAGEEEKSVKEEKEQEEKEQKKKQERLKLDAKTLLYNTDNGLRKFYEVITNTEFNSKDNTKNLDKLINLTRNWHFMLFPNYDFDFFTNKLISLGKQAPTKSYMSRVRRIYKGEENWDIIYDEQAQILGKASIMNDKKEFINPNPENNNDIKNKNVNVNEDNIKNDEQEYNDEEQGIIQDLFLKDEILEEENNKKEKSKNDDDKNNKNINEDFEVKDSDFDNFPDDDNPELEYEKSKKLVSDLKNPSQHETLLNTQENKLNNMTLVTGSQESHYSEKKKEINGDEISNNREHPNFMNKRTSDQIFGDNNEEENNENLKPELLDKKMIIED